MGPKTTPAALPKLKVEEAKIELEAGGKRVLLWWLFSLKVMSNSFKTPRTVDHQAPLSMGFPKQENWSGLPSPSPGDLSDPGIKPGSPALKADSLLTELNGEPRILYI